MAVAAVVVAAVVASAAGTYNRLILRFEKQQGLQISMTWHDSGYAEVTPPQRTQTQYFLICMSIQVADAIAKRLREGYATSLVNLRCFLMSIQVADAIAKRLREGYATSLVNLRCFLAVFKKFPPASCCSLWAA